MAFWWWIIAVVVMAPLWYLNMTLPPGHRWNLVPLFGYAFVGLIMLQIGPGIYTTLSAPHEYHIPDCPGAGMAELEIRVQGNGGLGNLITQFADAGWGNLTTSTRGTNGFWSSPYEVVRGTCHT